MASYNRTCYACETQEGNQMAHYGGCMPNYELYPIWNFDNNDYSICYLNSDNIVSSVDSIDFNWFVKSHKFNLNKNPCIQFRELPITRSTSNQLNLPAYCNLVLYCEYNKTQYALVYNTKLDSYTIRRKGKKCEMKAPGDVWCEIQKLF